ncbi:MAG: hypothetical protein LBG49_01305 [Mycoplasmataceae bacterium]|jgi:transposase|nr:hypothetical protein [Mycoplasmataceae bacterium]
MKNNKEYKITKSSYSRLIGATFECAIINRIVNKPPIWFQEFEKRNNARLDRIETRLSENDVRLDRIDAHLVKIDARLDNIVKKNKLVE